MKRDQAKNNDFSWTGINDGIIFSKNEINFSVNLKTKTIILKFVLLEKVILKKNLKINNHIIKAIK